MGSEPLDFVRLVKAYRLEHRCSLQEAIDACRTPPPAREMTEKTSLLGQVEQEIATLLVRMPDMSGDQRRRLRDDQYRQVQSIAREVVALCKTAALSSQEGDHG